MSETTAYSPPPLPSPFTHTSPRPTLLTQGAEAHLYKTASHLAASQPAALKIRPAKPYRHPILDRRLTRQRILHEARCLLRLVKEGVSVPALLALDWEGECDASGVSRGGAWLLMEWIEGAAVRTVFERWETWLKGQAQNQSQSQVLEDGRNRVSAFMARIGRLVGALHAAGVVHGDLTTSNLMLRGSRVDDGRDGNPSMDGDVVLIDFGLAVQSSQDEDRAVDLYVLERAFGSTHPRTEPFFGALLQGYRESYKGAGPALKRLEDVRMRGRKRSMIG